MRRLLMYGMLLPGLFWLMGSACKAQTGGPTHIPQVIDAHIDFQSQEISNGYVVIKYSLPFSGMVEFRLFDEEGKQLWQNQYTNTFGDNRIVLRASKLTPGKTYAYQMVYKRNMIMKNLEIPSGGTE